MATNDSLNTQLAESTQTSPLADLQESLQKVFESFIGAEDENHTPRTGRLLEDAQDPLRKLYQKIREIRQKARSSAGIVQSLQTIDICVTSNRRTAWALGLQLQGQFNATSRDLDDTGENILEGTRCRFIEFQNQKIRPAKAAVNSKLLESRGEQRPSQNYQFDFEGGIEAIEPLSSLDPTGLAGVVAVVTKSLARFFSRKNTEDPEEALVAMQQRAKLSEAELRVINKIEQKTVAAHDELAECGSLWKEVQTAIFGDVEYEISMIVRTRSIPPQMKPQMKTQLDASLMHLEQFDTQCGELLERFSPYYGPASVMTSKVKAFHEQIKDISAIFSQLLSAKQIIRDRHEAKFIQKARELGRHFSEYLSKIQAVFVPWTIYLKRSLTGPLTFIPEITTVTRDTAPFEKLARALISEIKATFTTEISKHKSKEARERQKEEDRNGTTIRLGKFSIATLGQGLDTLQALEDAIDVILSFSRELQMSLFHHDSRRTRRSDEREETEPELFPADFFLVSERLASEISIKLATEITRLTVECSA